MTATAKKATARKTAAAPTPAPAPVKPATRTDLLARMVELGYTGPTSFTASMLRETVLPWLEAGSPEGDESIPAGVRYAVHPHLKPAPKSGGNEARTIARDLRRAVANVLTVTGDDQAEALNEVEGLAARLRELLVTA